MSNIASIDGHAVVVSEEERQARLHLVRQEGAHLMSLYQSIPDKEVREAILALVTSMSKLCGRPVPDRGQTP